MGRILGVDYGDVRVGLALSDTTKLIASPFKTIQNKNSGLLISKLKEIISENDVESIVVGFPIGMKGQDTNQTVKVKDFIQSLSTLCLPIFLEDERLSSIAAKKSLFMENIKTGHNKEIIDQRAAAIVLQQFLDRIRTK
tara:strand:+ start:904 stop:1320 length:417 start_codon:yes stop_codon:yes gene_type:complete